MNLSLSTIISHINTRFLGFDETVQIDNVSLDSRSPQNNQNTLFFAIIGPNYNSHIFIPELVKNGVRNFVVSEVPIIEYGDLNFLVVEDTLKALQRFAAYYRSLFHFPIIGITGSNGKTIVKEWINFLLSPEYNIIRSPKSYNSQVGVPLSVLGINEGHNLGIFEAGISTTDEMKSLEKIIKPTIGILTGIGSAHDEGFENLGQKIKEKLKLFKEVGLLIYPKNKTVDAFLPSGIKTFSWSSNDKTADVLIHFKTENQNTFLNITYQDSCTKIKVPFSDEASIENAIHCMMLMLYFKYDFDTIQKRLEWLYPIEMRLKVKNGINKTTLIDDSYSSDFQSLKIALDFLENQSQHSKKTLILSDIFQSGLSEEELYSRISQLIIAHKITRVIGVGKTISKFKNKFPNCLTFGSIEDFVEEFEKITFENETILVKGARSFHFEEIVALLEEKTHETVLEINLNALSHNLNYYKAKLFPKTQIMAMIKAFGYGSGGPEIAKLLEYHKVNYLGVAFADEGIMLRLNGIQTPIMIMNPETSSFSSLIQYNLEPEIYSLKSLRAFLKIVRSKKLKNYPIHIKIDTGMHRLGFEESQIDELISILNSNSYVLVKSILSHLATSDDLKQRDFVLKQISLFEIISSRLISELNITPIRHILNTSGISNYSQHQYDMVRLGIGLYGISGNIQEQNHLEPVGTLKSVISQIRTIPKGDSVGYGRRFIAERETRVATIPIGYADGIRRMWGSNGGYVTIQKQKAPIIGSICMDMLMVDVTDIPCVEGNQAIILGSLPSVFEIAEALQTIPYEILTGISHRVKRIFYRE